LVGKAGFPRGCKGSTIVPDAEYTQHGLLAAGQGNPPAGTTAGLLTNCIGWGTLAIITPFALVACIYNCRFGIVFESDDVAVTLSLPLFCLLSHVALVTVTLSAVCVGGMTFWFAKLPAH
jgi:hypothetical protein